MLTIGLFPNTKKKNIKAILESAIEYLSKRNVRVVLPDNAAVELGYKELACAEAEMKNQITFGITFGGDGTLLHTVRDLASYGIPVCGVNLGQLGFLAEVEVANLNIALDKLIHKDYYIEERLMLEAFIVRQDESIYVSSALNDVVISKGGFSRMIRLKLFIDEVLTENYPADGLIIATSTGSTGYSLSAGGPIVNPSLKVMVITPICPHSLHARSLIVSEDEKIKVGMQTPHNEIFLTVDGQIVHDLMPEDEILVRRSQYRAKFIKFNTHSYYEMLHIKLGRGIINADN